MSAEEQIALMKAARKERREDLQEVMDAHVGSTATSILLFNQARLAARLMDADPNAAIDVPAGEEQDESFSEPVTETSS